MNIYFKVPFVEKKHAKEIGCKWDSNKKLWYYVDDQTTHSKFKILECFKMWGHNKPPFVIYENKNIELNIDYYKPTTEQLLIQKQIEIDNLNLKLQCMTENFNIEKRLRCHIENQYNTLLNKLF